jgi:membrane-associated phospholipid phosphatase
LKTTAPRTRFFTPQVLAGLILFAAFWWLGTYVSVHPEPPALWAFAQAVHGQAIGLAWVLTCCGFGFVLAPLYVVCLIFACVNRAWRTRAIFTVVCALVSWIGGDRLQHFFHRPRRPDWIIQHVHAFSYPSTHASISTDFYFLWGLLLLRSSLPARVRYAAFALLTAFTLAIMWSRLSLGAHYPTDVLGGALFGLVIILLGERVVQAAGGRLSD